MDGIKKLMYLEVLKEAMNLFVENDYPVPQVIVDELNECLNAKRELLDQSAYEASENIRNAAVKSTIEWLKTNTYFIPKEIDVNFLYERITNNH